MLARSGDSTARNGASAPAAAAAPRALRMSRRCMSTPLEWVGKILPPCATLTRAVVRGPPRPYLPLARATGRAVPPHGASLMTAGSVVFLFVLVLAAGFFALNVQR